VAELTQLVAEIAAAGHRHVFGITGSGATLTLVDQLEQNGVEFVRTAFEGSAALMAGTVGRLTGHAGIAIAIKGPGLANMVPGLAVSWFEASPMVAIIEAYGPASPLTKAHKRLDHHMLAGPVSKGVRALAGAGLGFAEAARCAETECPGPVVLELTGGNEPGQPSWPPPPPPPAPAGSLERAVRMIEAAQRPVVVAGSLAVRSGWSHLLNQLTIPVFSTAAAKGVVDERLPHAAGVYTGVGLSQVPEAKILTEADLVVCLGVRPMEVLATKSFPCAAVGFDAIGDLPGSEGFGFAESASDGDIAAAFAALSNKSWGLSALADCRSALAAHMIKGPFLPAQSFNAIADRFGADVRMVMDTGYFCTIGEHIWRAPAADLCLLSGQGRYMGTGVPMALAAALADQSRPTIAVVGDGGIGMYAGELRLAVERQLPLLLVLMTDGRFGSIATRALKDGLTLAPLTINAPSWMPILEGMGFRCARAESAEDLAAALQAWDSRFGPGYLEIAYDPDAYEKMVACIR